MKKTNTIPAKVKKLIFQEANSTCPFCGETDISVLEIHHIIEKAQGGTNQPENLILVCSNCHAKITNGDISFSEVTHTKSKLFAFKKISPSSQSITNIVQIEGGTHSGIIANIINFPRTKKTSRKFNYPVGSIGANLIYRNYAKYLIDRYNEFKKADKNITDFRYAVVYRSIQLEFKCKWDFIPEVRFNELVIFLQNKIDKTILGKVRKNRGQKNYETFDEYKLKMM